MEKEKKYLIDPTLMAEWNYEKNNELGLDPKPLTCSSHKKAWWVCKKGHSWEAGVAELADAQASETCGQPYEFKSHRSHQKATIV